MLPQYQGLSGLGLLTLVDSAFICVVVCLVASYENFFGWPLAARRLRGFIFRYFTLAANALCLFAVLFFITQIYTPEVVASVLNLEALLTYLIPTILTIDLCRILLYTGTRDWGGMLSCFGLPEDAVSAAK